MTATELVIGKPADDTAKPADDDLRLWSVTTLIGALDKPALQYWSAEQTAIAAHDLYKTWVEISKSSGRDEAIDWLKRARFRVQPGQRTAADLGTAVHAACEEYALTGTRPDVDAEVSPFLDQFDKWLHDFQPEYQATEVAVYHPGYGYAGTCDCFVTIGGVRFIGDYKSTRTAFDKKGNPAPAYPEVALQLAAYRYAEKAAMWRPRRFEAFRRRYYLLSPAELEQAADVPEVDHGLCIKITPEHCIAYPIECGPEVFESFLYVTEAARWQFEQSKRVIGAPLVPPGAEAAA